MFNHLALFNFKVLKKCKMLNLGKINIICGKNNSGKSTILQALRNQDKRSIGIFFDSKLFEEFFNQLVGRRIWGGDNQILNDSFKRILKEVIQNNNVWFPEDYSLLVRKIIEKRERDINLSNHPFNQDVFKISYLNLFEEDLKPILIPPKRDLKFNIQIQTDEEISPEGNGILNYLFFAKNQEADSKNRKIYEEILKAFKKISSDYDFDIISDSGNILRLKFSSPSKSWIPAEDCGLGLQELILILYYAIHPDYKIILVEEPENHLHPEMQKKLLYFLRNTIDKQFFITTHSNVFLDNALIDKVFFTQFDNEIVVSDATSRASILDNLGYSVTDNLVSDLVILVEGPKDTPVIEEFLIKFGLYEKYTIKIWPLGGDIMDQLDISVFAEHYKLIGLIDNDPESGPIRKRFKENCDKYSIEVHKLEKYSIENYFTIRALKEVFGAQLDEHFAEIRPDLKLEKQIGFNVKNKSHRLAKTMTIEEIRDTDLYEFFEKVQRKLEN
ncbi:hypothetical protein BROC_00136 [Candidatus Brocadiaceae bacterium]|nr:hypothetical protein BROC_00136 [Candidatus Brocadiaceae bacterium]